MADHIWDWDLYAVVRGYTYAATASTAVAAIPPPPVVPNTTPFHHVPTTTTTLSPLATLTFREDQNDPFAFPNLSQPTPPITTQSHHTLQELQQLLLPTDQNHHRHLHLQNQMNLEFPQSQPANSGVNLVKKQAQAQAPRSRKRKVQLKKMVCRVTAENVSTDLWAWRKYGQKPIKGSPFPRNYYRCSSNKGCAARKQVERSVTDPETFVVTYTGDHSHPPPTHRNSLAGSTRSKPSSTAAAKAKAHAAQAGGSNPPARPENNEEAAAEETMSPGESYPSTEPDSQKTWSDDDEEIMMIPNMSAMTEDIFLGLNPFGGGGESSGGSSPTSQLGSVPHDSVSGTSRFSPG